MPASAKTGVGRKRKSKVEIQREEVEINKDAPQTNGALAGKKSGHIRGTETGVRRGKDSPWPST